MATTRFSFGDVVPLPLPFTNQTAAKRRPAVVVSSTPRSRSSTQLSWHAKNINLKLTMPNQRFRCFGTSLIGIGIDPRKLWSAVRALPLFLRDSFKFYGLRSPADKEAFSFHIVPVLSDRFTQSGVASGHYFHQDLWAARHIFRRAPQRHIDVGSRVDGFIAHLLCFREVEVVDIRSLKTNVSGLRFIKNDMMSQTVTFQGQADSVSCLHALEHFGLGRYGDPIDVDGWRKGFANLAGLVRSGGTLYLSVPVGRGRIEFNAQRIFSTTSIIEEADRNGLQLETFSLIDDDGEFEDNVDPGVAKDLSFGCGCFIFLKPTGTS